MPDRPRLLILTAAFGEGHNSAARNMALALEAAGAEARVCDPCMLSVPRTTATVSALYRCVTNHFPAIWERIYQSTDRCDFSKPRLPLMRKPERCLQKLLEEYQPSAVICTYPLYPYFLQRIFGKTGNTLPVFTIITDSIEINASWLRAPTGHWLVTDALTRESMIRKNLPAGKIIDTGFAVNPVFSTLKPLESDDPQNPQAPFRVLYFPTGMSHVRRHSRAMLDASPSVHLTIVMGKNLRRLHKRAREIKDEHPGRVRLMGWTKRVPQLLTTHHLVVGKAGGATVHEAIAARCPMLIHHLVPGQEEGNLRLLEAIGGGRLAESAGALGSTLTDLLADQRAGWKAMKQNLQRHGRNAGATAAAAFILDHLHRSP